MLYFRYPSYTIDCYKLTTKYIYIQNHMFVFLQSKLKYFPRIFIYEQGVLFVKLSFVNIMVRKIICSEISAITVVPTIGTISIIPFKLTDKILIPF